MTRRLDAMKAAPQAYPAVRGLENYVRQCGLDAKLLHLLKIRASQINGCAFCIDMHVKEALADGEDPQRIYLISAWRESPLYDARERALLAWTEAVTKIAETGAPDAEFDALREHFSDAEVVNFTVAIATINVWNRLAVSFRTEHPIGMQARVR